MSSINTLVKVTADALIQAIACYALGGINSFHVVSKNYEMSVAAPMNNRNSTAKEYCGSVCVVTEGDSFKISFIVTQTDKAYVRDVKLYLYNSDFAIDISTLAGVKDGAFTPLSSFCKTLKQA